MVEFRLMSFEGIADKTKKKKKYISGVKPKADADYVRRPNEVDLKSHYITTAMLTCS